MRLIRRAAALILVVISLAVTAAPEIGSAGPPVSTARHAATGFVGTEVSASGLRIPADFASVMGYAPTTARLADGSVRLINPRGGCSVPGHGAPYDLTVACQAHDLGYDLLRYADDRGAPLAPSVRQRIDDQLYSDLRTQCRAEYPGDGGCTAEAETFRAGVWFNSWRQRFGPPVAVSGLDRTAGLVLLVAAVAAATVTVVRRRRALSRRALSRRS
jgi:hypothetical protein